MTVDYVVAQTHTTDLVGPERREFWRDHVRLNQGRLDFVFGRPDGFDGSTIVQRAGEHQLIEFWSDPVAYVHPSRQARGEDDRSLRLVVPRAGSVTIERPDEVVVIEPGWAGVVSMSSGFTVRHDQHSRAWILNVPEDGWLHLLPPDRTTRVDLRAGVGSVTRTLIETLSAQRAALSAAQFESISAKVCDLLGLCLDSGAGGRLAVVERAARDLVRRESDDPDLTPATLADRLGWSLRQVQSALAVSGTTPSALIRTARLSRARARLLSPGHRGDPIAEIAYRSGFGSLSGFNLAFREEFSASPRALRAATG